jgi:hypothetical protein
VPDGADAQAMVGTVIGIAAAAAAAVIALAGHALGTTSPASGAVSPFGGSVPVHIAHVGHIDVDLQGAGSSGLRGVRCATGPATSSCFVAH